MFAAVDEHFTFRAGTYYGDKGTVVCGNERTSYACTCLEIERMREALEIERKENEDLKDRTEQRIAAAADEIERLRKALQDIVDNGGNTRSAAIARAALQDV